MNERNEEIFTNGEKPKHIAEFVNGLLIKDKIDLVIGISDGNKRQQGENLLLFVELVNNNSAKINSVEIMVTGYIQRHYHGEEEALRRRDRWIEQNKDILRYLSVPYKITDWKDIIETTEFQEDLKKIYEIVKEDEGFITKVNNLAKAHKQKGSEEKAREYLLEEAAYFFNRKVHVCYPSDNLNIACEHIIEKYNSNAVFHAYRFKPRSYQTSAKKQKKLPAVSVQTKKIETEHLLSVPQVILNGGNGNGVIITPTPEELFFATVSVARLMSQLGLHGSREKTAYFNKVVETTEPFFKFPLLKKEDVSDAQTQQYEEKKVSVHT